MIYYMTLDREKNGSFAQYEVTYEPPSWLLLKYDVPMGYVLGSVIQDINASDEDDADVIITSAQSAYTLVDGKLVLDPTKYLVKWMRLSDFSVGECLQPNRIASNTKFKYQLDADDIAEIKKSVGYRQLRGGDYV